MRARLALVFAPGVGGVFPAFRGVLDEARLGAAREGELFQKRVPTETARRRGPTRRRTSPQAAPSIAS